MISPQSKHLFQKAILISGSALNPYLPTKSEHSAIIKKFAENLNHTIRNEIELIEFLNQVDGKVLYENTYINIFNEDLGRKGLNRYWTVFVEGIFFQYTTFWSSLYLYTHCLYTHSSFRSKCN